MIQANPDRARTEAQRIIQAAGLKAPPVPIDKIVRSHNIILQYAPLEEELSGLAFYKDGRAIIGVNALHHPNRQRFSVAHELAHHVLHRDEIATTVHVDKVFKVLHRDETASLGTDPLEIDANAFAAELLMPEQFLREAIGDEGLDIEDDTRIEALARKFRVSPAAMRYRLSRRP